jgi:trans-AT polyketide synthase/acyltransferase/oxidoreductase domain-containing protein
MQLATPTIQAAALGNAQFRADYGLKYAYLAGAMFKGIASKELVVAMGQAGLMAYLGSGGLKLERLADDLAYIEQHLPAGASYGVNLLNPMGQPELERRTVELFLARGVRFIEAAAYMKVSPQIVRFRFSGATRDACGTPRVPRHVLAKVSRPEVAAAFMAPAPEAMLRKLVEEGHLSVLEADIAAQLPVAGDICVESDSAGHTDQGVAFALIPAMLRLRERVQQQHGYRVPIRIGAAGGIGSPEAAAAAFMLGADFVMTGSINQCTVEAGTSARVKDMLQAADVQDTTYAPAGDMFELGAKVQVLRKGLFFAARANKLYDLYLRHNSIDELDAKSREQIQTQFFKRSFEEVWQETKAYYLNSGRKTEDELERNGKQKMALIFRWYFIHSARLAASGSDASTVDYQVHCGPAMGSFNQWVRGTELESWRNRRVADLAERIMQETALLLSARLRVLAGLALPAAQALPA